MIEQRKVALSTGIMMNVALAGPDDGPPVILLHGFPESHRIWREIAKQLGDRVRLVMPDLRGFGDSDRPQDVAYYATDTLIADIFALADALRLDRFALVGHDWGGAIAWAAALRGDPRISRLAIVNSPHPLIFQKSLIEDEDQRAASQYMRAFRNPGMEAGIEAMGFDTFFDKSFAKHVDVARISPAERQIYIEQWSRPGALTAMLNWYRSSQVVVPGVGEEAPMPDWVARGVPKLKIPVRVIWGMEDKALLPIQLEGIGEVGEDVEVFPLRGVGHFAPWEAPDRVAAALGPFLADR
ncbi:MAG TPA: alpha/beta hydrolase [Sphingomicrobium sp.]|nr:alpha/beta hydrolase [Sphingomicrobium sp.]